MPLGEVASAPRRGLGEKLRHRLRGVPRTFRELERSLFMLATLRRLGWHASVRAHRPVDARLRPIAWLTYPAIAWLEPLLRRSDMVFEFGAGQSTLWFADRVKEVVSVDHDPRWADRVMRSAPSNSGVLLRRSEGDAFDSPVAISEYAGAIDGFPAGYFDVVLVDGMERNRCAARAIEHLRSDGLIVYDNSDRPRSQDGIATLQRAGFHRIDFVGLVAGYGHLSCTSVFFRDWDRWTVGLPPPPFLGA